MVFRKSDFQMLKNEKKKPEFRPYFKNSPWMKDLNLRPEIIKLHRTTWVGGILQDIVIGKYFLDRTPEAQKYTNGNPSS